MHNDRLRLVLRLNAGSSLLTGILLAAGASALAAPLGADATFLRVAGIGLVPFAIFVAWLAERDEPDTTLVRAVSACDFAWVVGSLYVVLAMPFTPIGKAFVLAVALAVEAFGTLQLLFAHRRAQTFARA